MIFSLQHPSWMNITLKKIAACAEEFFNRLEFKEGREVALTATPEINSETSWGWMGSRHFLKKGAKGGVVREVDFCKGKVRVGVEFYNQTYICDGIEKPISSPDIYIFRRQLNSYIKEKL